MPPVISRFRISFAIALATSSVAAASALAASICDGLRARGLASESLYDPGQALAGIPQLPHQNTLTGCWRASPYVGREACRHGDRYGKVNGRFGSCATFTAFAAAQALAHATGLALPARLHYGPAELVRVYDDYGNAWDPSRPGTGDFLTILGEIARELELTPGVDADLAARFRRQSENYQSFSSPENPAALAEKINLHFEGVPGRALPVELILDGWVLDHVPAQYCPIRNAKAYCDARGTDQRNAHSALLVGRRLRGGVCEALVRNSWKGACRNGRYASTGRECVADADSVWIPEAELAAGLSGVRGIW